MFSALFGKEWRQLFVPFKATMSLPKVIVTYHLGFHPQTVEIGGVQLINYGPKMDYKLLPGTKMTYKGRKPDAPWRATAARRIEHRVAGADANPYLVIAGILGASLHGIVAGMHHPTRSSATPTAPSCRHCPMTGPRHWPHLSRAPWCRCSWIRS